MQKSTSQSFPLSFLGGGDIQGCIQDLFGGGGDGEDSDGSLIIPFDINMHFMLQQFALDFCAFLVMELKVQS